MVRLAAILFLILFGKDSFIELKRIDDGSKLFFKIDKVFPNPMSNPNNVFFDFNLPDTLNVKITLLSMDKDTVYSKTYDNLPRGKFQCNINYKDIANIKAGKYYIDFLASRYNDIKYNARIKVLLL